MTMEAFSLLAEQAHQIFEAQSKARDEALAMARQITRYSAHAIRAIHRSEHESAHQQLADDRAMVQTLQAALAKYPMLYYAGYTQDALKEYAEAHITVALIENQPLPTPEDLNIEYPVFLNGLAEVTGELRRRCMDILRQGYSEEAERLLTCMDEIYAILITMDYPDALTNGLRRQTDLVRGIVERTRGDLTISLREQTLQQALQDFSKRLWQENE